jgi:hypothetical protein
MPVRGAIVCMLAWNARGFGLEYLFSLKFFDVNINGDCYGH